MSARERLEQICGPQTPPELIAELDTYQAEVLATDGQAYAGELAMLRGLVATIRAVAAHGDLTEVRKLLDEHARDDAEAREKSTAASGDATPELTVYRAEHDSGMPLCTYTNLKAAQKHCESYVRREHPSGDALVFDWIPDDEDDTAIWELVAQLGEDESTTGYCVAVVDVASEYDEEADE